jgi:NAD+ synthase
MADRFRLTLAQLNPVVGDLAGNAARARDAWAQARAAGADMLALPEMFLVGYQPQDLAKRPAFLRDVGGIWKSWPRPAPTAPPSASARRNWPPMATATTPISCCRAARSWRRCASTTCPIPRSFDEHRLYVEAPISGPYRLGPIRIGTPICEDAWFPDVAETQAESGAELLLVPNGSPYHRGKLDRA